MRVPVWSGQRYLGAPVPYIDDAKRAMRGQAFGASGPSLWTDVRCLRAITSTTIRPALLPCGAGPHRHPSARGPPDGYPDVCARSHAHDKLHARSPSLPPVDGERA